MIRFPSTNVLIFGLLLWTVITGGCIGSDYVANRDILVFKVDAEGREQWHTLIDTGGDDAARAFVETSDGSYIIGGQIATVGTNYKEFSHVLELDGNGSVVWNASSPGESVNSIMQTAEGTVAAVSGSLGGSRILLFDSSGVPLGKGGLGEEMDGIGLWIIPTSDGGAAIAGETVSRGIGAGDVWVLKLDKNWVPAWQRTFDSGAWDYTSSIFQTSDGGYLVGARMDSGGLSDRDLWILRLDPSGILLWNQTFHESGIEELHFMQEIPGYGFHIIYKIAILENNRWKAVTMEAVMDLDGNVRNHQTLNASCPVIRTSDGGYAFAELSSRDDMRIPRILKFDARGSREWETFLNAKLHGGAVISITETYDGGYAVLINAENPYDLYKRR
ncbi:MAG: hypothetical protein QMC96_13265 [Methanomicrobiales archaeon]|nr:hypothetical protein [Methanomicrobiales archaeon]